MIDATQSPRTGAASSHPSSQSSAAKAPIMIVPKTMRVSIFFRMGVPKAATVARVEP